MNRKKHSGARRSGSFLVEATVALAVIVIAAGIVAQCIVWSLQERARSQSHHAALELAANVLESARAVPFDKLDADWAKSREVPSEMADLLPEGKVIATLDSSASLAPAKRITVEVQWLLMPGQPPQSVRLTTVLSPREAKKAGGQS